MENRLEGEPSLDRTKIEPYVQPADNKYDFFYFSPEMFPQTVLLAKQIQAQSYLNMEFVQPEGLVTVGRGIDNQPIQILASDIDNPARSTRPIDVGGRVEYVLGYEKESTDIDPLTGKMVTWKKYYAPLEALPAYQLCKNNLDPGMEDFLRYVDESRELQLVEIEAMGKTENAGSKVIAELMRTELRRVLGKGEIWYFSIVDSTYQAFINSWGTAAVHQIGEPKQLDHPHVSPDIQLVPAIIDVDYFFYNVVQESLRSGNEFADKQLRNFFYLTDGLSDAELGEFLADFRRDAMAADRAEEVA